MKNLRGTKWNLLSLVMRNFNFVCFCGRIKEVFLFLSKTKTICPKDAGLSFLSLGWEEKKNQNLATERSDKQHRLNAIIIAFNLKNNDICSIWVSRLSIFSIWHICLCKCVESSVLKYLNNEIKYSGCLRIVIMILALGQNFLSINALLPTFPIIWNIDHIICSSDISNLFSFICGRSGLKTESDSSSPSPICAILEKKSTSGNKPSLVYSNLFS